MLVGLYKLMDLCFAFNLVTFIDQYAFKDLKSLNTVDFSGNKLSFFNERAKIDLMSPFFHCHYLEVLKLSNNNISTFFEDWLEFQLTKLDLTNNSLTHIEVNILNSTFL